jgi:hypothetical protein
VRQISPEQDSREKKEAAERVKFFETMNADPGKSEKQIWAIMQAEVAHV